MKRCPSCGISDFVKPTRLLLFLPEAAVMCISSTEAYIQSIICLPAIHLDHTTLKSLPKLKYSWQVDFLVAQYRLVCLFHVHYPCPSGSQIIVCQPLKIQSNPRAMGKSAAELLFIRNQRNNSELSGMFLLLKISILSFFPITLSSLLSLFLHSEVKDFFFFFWPNYSTLFFFPTHSIGCRRV